LWPLPPQASAERGNAAKVASAAIEATAQGLISRVNLGDIEVSRYARFSARSVLCFRLYTR
jgi:hypothetical protein